MRNEHTPIWYVSDQALPDLAKNFDNSFLNTSNKNLLVQNELDDVGVRKDCEDSEAFVP